MTQVDPDDDAIRRFVIWHFCFDPSRNERRNVVVAAYDDEQQFELEVQRLAADLEQRKQHGAAEDVERIAGTVLEPGSRASAQLGRNAWRAARAASRSSAADRAEDRGMRQGMRALLDGGYQQIVQNLDRLMSGEIAEAEWHERNAELIRSAYLSADTPWGGSGKGGQEADWIQGRGGIAYAFDRDGTLLDVGCANGFLMECMPAWSSAHGVRIEPYGLDIVAEFVDLARSRLPQWADRIWVGNVLTWTPPHLFDYVRTGLEYVPPWRRHQLVIRLLAQFVAPDGRLIIGPMTEPIDQPLVGTFLNSCGLVVAGMKEMEHRTNDRAVYRTYWLNN